MKMIMLLNMIMFANAAYAMQKKAIFLKLNPDQLVVQNKYIVEGHEYTYAGNVAGPDAYNDLTGQFALNRYVFVDENSFVSRVLLYDDNKKQWMEYH